MPAFSFAVFLLFTLVPFFVMPGAAWAESQKKPGRAKIGGRPTVAKKTHPKSPAFLDPLTLPEGPQAVALGRADLLWAKGDLIGAQAAIEGLHGSSAALVRARIARAAGNPEMASKALQECAHDSLLVPLIKKEEGLLAIQMGNDKLTRTLFEPMLDTSEPFDDLSASALARAWLRTEPKRLVTDHVRLLRRAPNLSADTRSLLLDLLAQAQRARGDEAGAKKTGLFRYLSEPVSSLTPREPPEGTAPSAPELLGRANLLLAAHRNSPALEGYALTEAKLGAEIQTAAACEVRCGIAFGRGTALRKQHRYKESEVALQSAIETCRDPDVVRRASYLYAKVVSIADGLRAIEPLEAFVKRYPTHTMSDDVLFWIGDIYQRRGRDAEADAAYARIDALPFVDDQCQEARWRRAWLAYRKKDDVQAERLLMLITQTNRCVPTHTELARAHFWLGQLAERNQRFNTARFRYEDAMRVAPLSFYAQSALTRLLELSGTREQAQLAVSVRAVPPEKTAPRFRIGPLADNANFRRGLEFLRRGLFQDATTELLRVKVSRSVAHPSATGHETATRRSRGAAERDMRLQRISAQHSEASQSALLVALLLDRAGAHRAAHQRLKTDFADVLSQFPLPEEYSIWRAAYPLAFRSEIEAGEHEGQLPSLALQALAREESALDPRSVSWAEAYGLTQLLLSSARDAGAMLKPPQRIERAEALFEPGLSARLGGAYLGHKLRHFGGSLALALGGYNAGDEAALGWWNRFSGQSLWVMSEEIGIKETRAYVQRVLTTYGIYRWLYTERLPVLAEEPVVPRKPS